MVAVVGLQKTQGVAGMDVSQRQVDSVKFNALNRGLFIILGSTQPKHAKTKAAGTCF